MTDKFYDDSVAFLNRTGWEYRKSGTQYAIKRCPFCQDERTKFYIAQEKPLFKCHHCGEEGNLYQLAQHLDLLEAAVVTPLQRQAYTIPTGLDKNYEAMRQDKDVQAYLLSRKLTGKTAAHFGLGVCEKNGARWLVIPHRIGGKAINCKYRSLPPAEKKFMRWNGARTVLFNQDALKNAGQVVITEGEIDAMSVSQAFGYDYPVIGVTAGCGSFQAEWVDLLKAVPKILICYDNDEPGQKGAWDVARRLGYAKCWNVKLEGVKDVNELHVKEGDNFKVAFQKFLDSAERFEVDGIVNPLAVFDRAFSLRRSDEHATPWCTLNPLISTEPGHMIVISADPKIGKTSFSLEWIRYRVNTFGDPCLFYCLEMPPETLIRKVVQLQFDVDKKRALFMRDEGRKYFQEREGLWYFCDKRYPGEPSKCLDLIRDATRRYGFKWVVFDHFHKLIRSLGNTTQEQANYAADFKALAAELEITLIVIAQPRKSNDFRKKAGPKTSDDVSGSHMLIAEADHVITIDRERLTGDDEEASFASEAIARIDATRWSPGGVKMLQFNGPSQKFVVPEMYREAPRRDYTEHHAVNEDAWPEGRE